MCLIANGNVGHCEIFKKFLNFSAFSYGNIGEVFFRAVANWFNRKWQHRAPLSLSCTLIAAIYIDRIWFVLSTNVYIFKRYFSFCSNWKKTEKTCNELRQNRAIMSYDFKSNSSPYTKKSLSHNRFSKNYFFWKFIEDFGINKHFWPKSF